jgi:hypothetical protein
VNNIAFAAAGQIYQLKLSLFFHATYQLHLKMSGEKKCEKPSLFKPVSN